MSTPTDVVPQAGWYRDPASPGVARWWDGTSWGTQTQVVPSEPEPAVEAQPSQVTAPPVGPEAVPLIAVAAATLTPEPPAGPPKRRRPSPSMPSVSLPRKPILIGIAVVVVAVGGWYAWSSPQSSSDAGPVTAHPVGAAAPAVNTASIHLPKVLPAKVAGQSRQTSAASVSAAKEIAARQRPVTRVHLAAYYGTSAADRFLLIGSTLSAAQAKPVPAAVERAQLVALLSAQTGGSLKAAKVVSVPAGQGAAGGVLSCVSAASHGQPASVCSWQNAT